MAALFTVVKRWKKPKCPLMDEGLNNMMESTHTVKYHSAFRKEILKHNTIWMNLEDITLSETSQSQKGKHCMTPLI